MATLAAVRRLSDGLLTGIQSSPNEPNQATMIQSAVNALGGAPEDWQYVELTPQQHDEIIAALPGRSFLVGGEIISATPPQLTSEVTDEGEVTVTCDVGDANYTGEISWECVPPDGIARTASGTAVAGVDTWEIQTGQQGTYTVRASTEQHGVAEETFSDG